MANIATLLSRMRPTTPEQRLTGNLHLDEKYRTKMIMNCLPGHIYQLQLRHSILQEQQKFLIIMLCNVCNVKTHAASLALSIAFWKR